ncbi:MAG: hypothetical protein E7588_09955 [Ruminococcaceae bacterium]|nr:hypothetical protein [Oscillospiraceae bacterium]
MHYTSFSLGGSWTMDYSPEVYNKKTVPEFTGAQIENAVPGYWEDMTERFLETPFFRNFVINPEYGLQQYPIADGVPDMALPNIVGNFFYRRTFIRPDAKGEAVIHFEGVQNSVSVWLNGEFLSRHEGYSTPFDIKIPDGILTDVENTLVLSVSNIRLEGYAGEPVSGITSRAASECTGGITGEVELRFYQSPLRDAALLVSSDLKEINVQLDSVSDAKYTWQVLKNGNVIKSGEAEGNFTFDTRGLARWSPECPELYTLKIACGDSVLERSFGVRRLTADGTRLLLNGKACFLRGVTEHCYYPETVNPPHDIIHYRNVIKNLKKLGFNFIRFHTYIPTEEYMQAADELGMLLHVESPNNTSLCEWREIVDFCRRHTSVVIYCCGNELYIDDAFIDHLRLCAEEVHQKTDSLFSPMSAMRGLEYCWEWSELEDEATIYEPFTHNPRRLALTGEFCDMYSSYARGLLSYTSLDADPEKLDDWSKVYNKPRVSHEICIDGTYTDLSLKSRYEGTRIGKIDMFNSIERHLRDKGLLHKAPLYFKNSCEWQRRVRKYCFEAARRCNKLAGFDFLGPIDTHWHTFGYDVGMMNEFYELKPGETVRNVLMYNSETVLLTDLGTDVNFTSEGTLSCGIYVSHFGITRLVDAKLSIRLELDGRIIHRNTVQITNGGVGGVFKLYDLSTALPKVWVPGELKLCVELDDWNTHAENEWELYIFPETETPHAPELVISDGMSADELEKALCDGKDVVIFGGTPFATLPTSFRISLAGRTSGNLATVIADHPALGGLPHEGFCGWQFRRLMEDGSAVCFESDNVPFDPIIEVVSTHKYAIRQSALFEFRALNGRLLVCSFNFSDSDPAAKWLKNRLISYAASDSFDPANTIDADGLRALINGKVKKTAANTNLAANLNDKTMRRKKN